MSFRSEGKPAGYSRAPACSGDAGGDAGGGMVKFIVFEVGQPWHSWDLISRSHCAGLSGMMVF